MPSKMKLILDRDASRSNGLSSSGEYPDRCVRRDDDSERRCLALRYAPVLQRRHSESLSKESVKMGKILKAAA